MASLAALEGLVRAKAPISYERVLEGVYDAVLEQKGNYRINLEPQRETVARPVEPKFVAVLEAEDPSAVAPDVTYDERTVYVWKDGKLRTKGGRDPDGY